MIAKVKMTYSVECFIKADNDEQLQDWLNNHTPRDAFLLANKYVQEDYDEEILCHVMDNSDYDIDISKKEG